MPEPKPGSDEVKIWLVWSLMKNGRSVLNVVCTEEEITKRYVQMLKEERNSNRVRWFVEATLANHLYGGRMG